VTVTGSPGANCPPHAVDAVLAPAGTRADGSPRRCRAWKWSSGPGARSGRSRPDGTGSCVNRVARPAGPFLLRDSRWAAAGQDAGRPGHELLKADRQGSPGVRRRPRYITYKRRPDKISIFEDFANGLGMPAAARRALGLDPETAGSGPYGQASGTSADIAGGSPGDVQPLLSNLLRASAVPVLSALREILHGYIEADRLMGSICVTGPISLQMPVVERACEVTRGTDRAEMLRLRPAGPYRPARAARRSPARPGVA
jgi:hypothetical protein